MAEVKRFQLNFETLRAWLSSSAEGVKSGWLEEGWLEGGGVGGGGVEGGC